VTSAVTTLGAERNLLDPSPESCRLIELKSPILTNEQLEKLRNVKVPGFRAVTLPILFDPLGGGAALKKAMDELCAAADKAAKDGVNLVILSDRGVSPAKAPIPALLAVAGLHHDMIRRGTRMKVGLVLESGEPREVHHYALLIGYGVGARQPLFGLRDPGRHDPGRHA
jgi:glutamate synthase (ferredoxin)